MLNEMSLPFCTVVDPVFMSYLQSSPPSQKQCIIIEVVGNNGRLFQLSHYGVIKYKSKVNIYQNV